MTQPAVVIQREALLAMRADQRNIAGQALLLGHHNQSWRHGGRAWPVITGAVPFSNHGQELSTLLSYHLADGAENVGEYAVGCCLLVDKDVHLARCASAYGESLVSSLLRVLTARLGEETDWEEVSRELVQLIERFVILIIVRRQTGQALSREVYAFDLAVPPEALHEALFALPSRRIDDGSVNSNFGHFDPIEFNALASLQATLSMDPMGMAARKLRRGNDPSVVGKQKRSGSDVETETASSMLGQGLRRRISVTPRDVEIEADESDERLNALLEGNAVLVKGPSESLNLVAPDLYAASVREYELLLMWMRFLSQPDDQLLKKLDQQESYEERMRSLSTKLKETLSPEDLLRTLASIQS